MIRLMKDSFLTDHMWMLFILSDSGRSMWDKFMMGIIFRFSLASCT